MELQNFLKFDEINPCLLTSSMKQYYEIKSNYKDFILLFKMGDFFETYFEDAIIFSDILNITLTKRKYKELGTVLMAGVPVRNINFYIEKLIKNDLKVIITDEFNEDKNKKIRKISKIYTGGTIIDKEFLNSEENNFLTAITKTNSVYDLCCTDISTGEIYITKGNFKEIKCELARINPKELLILKNDNIEKELYLPYKYEILDNISYDINNKAQSLIENYSKFILKSFIPQFEQIKAYNINKHLLMDFLTRKNLEITKNAYNNKKEGSLLWAVDNCKTPMGKRLLNSFISCPLIDKEKIEERRNAIKELLENKEKSDAIGNILLNTADIQRLSSKLSNKTINPLEFLILKDSIKLIEKLNSILKAFNSNLLKINSTNKEKLFEFYETIDKTITSDIEKIKNGDFIQDGANSEFDLYNFEFKKIKKEIENYKNLLIEKTNINSLDIENKNASFSICVPNNIKNTIPLEFKIKQKLKTKTKYTTEFLISLEEKYFSAKLKTEEIKKDIFENLKEKYQNLTSYFREFSKNIALIDVLYSFYKTSYDNSFSYPIISNDNEFEIKEGFHPAAKRIFENYSPLDIKFGNKNFILLTGENGSGKSTLLKQIAISVILNQTGCYVPCVYGKFPIFDRICTILDIKGEIINNKSTHQMQMKELSDILNSITDKSLILLDETGKNTSYKEGVALDFGIIEYLIKNTDAKTIFTTHFHILCDLTKNISSKISYSAIENKKHKRYVKEGSISKSNGILSAKKENLPDEIIETANRLIKNGF